MKSTRSSSVGASASRRRSTTSERRNNNEQTPTLRRSSRDRDAASPASPKSLRSRRRATSAEESLIIIRTPTPIRRDHEGRRSRNNRHPPKMVSGTTSTTTGDNSIGSDVLVADMEGTLVRVHLTVNGSRSSSSEQQGTTTKKHAPTFLGQDGNLFNCMVCREFGDVVCCDGCPHVYHPHCIPVGSPSRISLDNDEDPWFCPACIDKQTQTTTTTTPLKKDEGENNHHHHHRPPSSAEQGSNTTTNTRRTIKYRCQECQQTRPDLALQPCNVCSVHIHHPPCRGSSSPSEATAVLCSSCRAEAALNEEELELHAKKKSRRSRIIVGEEAPIRADPEVARPRRRTRSIDAAEEGYTPPDAAADNDDDDEDAIDLRGLSAQSAQKRKRPVVANDTAAAHHDDDETPTKSEKKKSKKRKRRKRDSDAHLPPLEELTEVVVEQPTTPNTNTNNTDADPLNPLEDGTQPQPQPQMRGPPTSATPAFHFYLVEQRPKIEKVLSRKHRYFNRLPKGSERNALIAKEAAMQWVKLSSVDQKRYINLSMRDYENRIIAWKEEKNIRDMMMANSTSTGTTDETTGEQQQQQPLEEADDDVDKPHDDSILTYEMHQRLYWGTSVGSKPYKPEPDQSHNRVLLDLLRDMRFHPLPMLSACRNSKHNSSPDDTQKVSIRHFDVQGPIATSVGDECLGCSRGWPHFCPVLQRRLPSIEQRSKLQPAASALISTRVGLGLRPRLERVETEEDNEDEETDNNNNNKAEFLTWRDAPHANDLRNVRFVPSGSLTDPTSRGDDIVEFVEEVVAMKIPEPPRPSVMKGKPTDSTPKKTIARGTLPTRHRKSLDGTDAIETASYETINKCGRCRTIIMTESGCVQCRRAQLVINMSKRQPPPQAEQHQPNESSRQKVDKANLLKVQTGMLGRVITKESIGESLGESDRVISNAILKERFTPCAILPSTTALAPSRPVASATENTTSIDARTVENYGFSVGTTPADSLSTPSSKSVDPQTGTEDRARNSRRSAGQHSSFESGDADRQALAKQQREQTDKIHKQTLSIACYGILLALIRRDPLLLFAQPVTAEGYAAIVKKPMDFSKIRSNVLANSYTSLGAFVADARLLCDNALIFNPPGSIYWKTAKELLDVLMLMQKRASRWITAIKNANASYWRKIPKKRKRGPGEGDMDTASEVLGGDPFKQLRQTWPEAVDMYENSDWFKSLLTADFTRTRENETAFYGALAVRRAAKAAEVCLAPYTDTGGVYSAVVKRSADDDEELRQVVDSKVAKVIRPIELREIATGREETVVRLMRKVQSRRLERRIGSENGCARCDGMGFDPEMKAVMNADVRWGRSKKKGDGDPDARVAASRMHLTTGLASANTRDRIAKIGELSAEDRLNSINGMCVSLRGSKTHGLGLYAEQHFRKGDVVAEYVGECVSLAVADAREKMYREMRIQDYQFRLDDSQIIDATLKGGLGRYINHSCKPNCVTKVCMGKPPNERLRRVIILAQRDIEPREELSYDYQFPLELNLSARIPCNCQSDVCRGFMNWDLPEKGANTGAIRTQKRGANMRDRIRRLGRPLKK